MNRFNILMEEWYNFVKYYIFLKINNEYSIILIKVFMVLDWF